MQESDFVQQSSNITLGRYHLLRCIGRGGMGEVWLAEDPLLHRQVAIKTLPAHNQDDHEYSRRFEREAQAAAALNHPHILPVHSYGEQPRSDGQVVMYIVMPYISGGSLAERITTSTSRKMMMPPQEAITYLSQAAEAGEKLTAWDVKSGKEIAKITLPRSFAILSKHVSVVVLRNALVWSPLDQHLVAAANIDVVALCDIRQREPFLLLGTDDPDLHKTPAAFPNSGHWVGSVFGITWSPNGRYIAASYTRSPKVYIWDLQERVPKTTRDGARLTSYIFGATGGHSSAIVDLQWSPDGRYLATASYDKTVIVWKVDETL